MNTFFGVRPMRKIAVIMAFSIIFAAEAVPSEGRPPVCDSTGRGQAAQTAQAQVPPAASYSVSSAISKIKIDGLLDDEAWKNATVVKLPFEWSPGENTPSPVETDCLVAYDRDNFYIAFRCLDPEPARIRAHLMDRDATDTLIQDDHVSILVDSFNPRRAEFWVLKQPRPVH